MSTRSWMGVFMGLAVALGLTAPAHAGLQTPCKNGKALVHQAYSECQKKGTKKVWVVVTDTYYQCPPKKNVVAFSYVR